MKWIVAAVAVLGIAGCANSRIVQAMKTPEQVSEEHDAKCREFGAQPGSQAYFDCRMELDARRAAGFRAMAADLAGGVGPVGAANNRPPSAPAPASNWTPSPVRSTVNCTSTALGNQTYTSCR